MAEEKFHFQSEASELLRMMIHSVYSNRDIFLRELISNASDALDKRRIESLFNSDDADFTPEIRIVRDREAHTLTVSDNGIGMTREEIVQYLGTIARSGTREFLEAGRSDDAGERLIGQFGVGFYSVFMVSERVSLVSRKLGTNDAFRFDSDGEGTYTLADAEREECGTTVTLYLRPAGEDGKDYTDEWTIRDIVKKYSDFIAWPIILNVSKRQDGKETFEDRPINSQKAIWCRPEAEVTEEEYREFYRHLTHDWKEPLSRVALNAEGSVSFKGLLFIPSEAPFDLFMNPKAGGIELYVKRVFIMNDCHDLIPEYMRFMRGVVDSEDLSLNISREILQDNPIIRVIRRSTQRKVFAHLRKLLETDRTAYEKFWTAFGRVLKEGVVQDREHAPAILELSLFRSTAQEGWTTLSACRERMKPDQEGILCLAGRDIDALRASPKLERLIEKGLEVLLMTDPVDEVILAEGLEFESVKLVNAAGDSAPAETEAERKLEEEKLRELEPAFAPLKKRTLELLGNVLEDVRPSLRMVSSPACLVDAANGMSLQMEQLMRAMGQEVRQQKRILELNAEHPLVLRLMKMAEDGDARVEDFLVVLYDQALILEGGSISDPASFVRRLSTVMALALQ